MNDDFNGNFQRYSRPKPSHADADGGARLAVVLAALDLLASVPNCPVCGATLKHPLAVACSSRCFEKRRYYRRKQPNLDAIARRKGYKK
jgi:hypothetical protein